MTELYRAVELTVAFQGFALTQNVHVQGINISEATEITEIRQVVNSQFITSVDVYIQILSHIHQTHFIPTDILRDIY